MSCPFKPNSGLHARMSVGAVVLAAGAGSRLGGRPKPMLELGGVPLIMRQLIALSAAGVDEVAVVVGHHAELIEAAVRPFTVSLATNPEPDAGLASSIRCGLAALSDRPDAILIAPADQPLIDAQDLVPLIGAFKGRNGASAVVPRVAAEPGKADRSGAPSAESGSDLGADPAAHAGAAHPGARAGGLPGRPLIISAELRAEWQAGGPIDEDWLAIHPDRVLWLPTTNRRYRIDIDTPEDLERFAATTGHRLSWPAALAD